MWELDSGIRQVPVANMGFVVWLPKLRMYYETTPTATPLADPLPAGTGDALSVNALAQLGIQKVP